MIFRCPASGRRLNAETMASASCASSWVGEFDFGQKARAPGTGAPRERPWRQSAAAVATEREAARRALGGCGRGGVDVAALQYVLRVQEAIDATPGPAEAVQLAATALLQAATNACGAEEVAAARSAAEQAVEAAGFEVFDTFAATLHADERWFDDPPARAQAPGGSIHASEALSDMVTQMLLNQLCA